MLRFVTALLALTLLAPLTAEAQKPISGLRLRSSKATQQAMVSSRFSVEPVT